MALTHPSQGQLQLPQHPSASTATAFEEAALPLAPAQSSCAQPDVSAAAQAGCGNSFRASGLKGPEATEMSLDLYLDELAAVRKALSLEQCHLMGHGWGGMLALAHLLRSGDAQGVASVTLVSTAPSWAAAISDRSRRVSQLLWPNTSSSSNPAWPNSSMRVSLANLQRGGMRDAGTDGFHLGRSHSGQGSTGHMGCRPLLCCVCAPLRAGCRLGQRLHSPAPMFPCRTHTRGVFCLELCGADAACRCMWPLCAVVHALHTWGHSWPKAGNQKRQAWGRQQGTPNWLCILQAQELEPAQRDQLLLQPAGTSTPEYAAAAAAFRQRFVTHGSTAQCIDTAERGRSEAVREALAGASLFKASISLVSHDLTLWQPVQDAAAPPVHCITLQ